MNAIVLVIRDSIHSLSRTLAQFFGHRFAAPNILQCEYCILCAGRHKFTRFDIFSSTIESHFAVGLHHLLVSFPHEHRLLHQMRYDWAFFHVCMFRFVSVFLRFARLKHFDYLSIIYFNYETIAENESEALLPGTR